MKVAFYEASPSDQEYLRGLLAAEHDAAFQPGRARSRATSRSPPMPTHCCRPSSIRQFDPASAIAAVPKLRCVATRLDRLRSHRSRDLRGQEGVAVQNAPRCGENTVAEHALALILSLSRNSYKLFTR